MNRRWKLALISAVLAVGMCLGGCASLEVLLAQAAGDSSQEAETGETELPQQSAAPTTPPVALPPASPPAAVPSASPPAGTDSGLGDISPAAGIAMVSESTNWSNNYYGVYAVDGDEGTCWMTQEGDTAGAWLEITFERAVKISELLIVNGIAAEGETAEWGMYGRAAALELVFNGDTDDPLTIGVKADGQYFSESFIPREVSTVRLRVLEVYPGTDYDNVAISEFVFWNDPDSLFADLADEDAPAQTPRPSQSASAPGQIEDKTGYAGPSWWSWKEGNNQFEDYMMRAGKWLSADGKISLYISYRNSPNDFDYGISYYGEVEQGNAVYLDENIPHVVGDGFRFKWEKEGEITVEQNGGDKHRLYLVRSK